MAQNKIIFADIFSHGCLGTLSLTFYHFCRRPYPVSVHKLGEIGQFQRKRAKNKQKLLESCVQQGPEGEKIKTKTSYIYHEINNDTINTEPLPEIVSSSKVNTKTIILARCGMLECGKNFKGSIPEICKGCGEWDDESHRLNRCSTWRHLNFSERTEKIDFGGIYSNDINVLIPVTRNIQRVWELHFGNGSMKKQVTNSD